ncbi:MAG TPA: hypothetical protein VFA12_05590 [Stellaceae bacterium]|nr:hypothetical protein [Stellaceae bacterium]
MTGFDLTANPFFLLKTHPRANREELAASLEEAVSEPGADEAALTAAFHALMLPLPRLQAELGWLGGTVSAGMAAALLDGTAPQSLFAELSPLATANIAAHLCRHGDPAHERRELALSCLVGMQAAIDPAAVAAAIDADRRVSGFPRIDYVAVHRGLEPLRAAQRDNAREALQALPQPAVVLARLLHEHGGSDGAAMFLGDLVEAFDNAIFPELTRRAAAVEAALTELAPDTPPLADNGTGITRKLSELEADLSAWAELARPRQLVMAAHLLDEPHSLALGATLREAALRFERSGHPATALALVRLGREACKPLPGFSQTLSRDESRLAAAPGGLAAAVAVADPPAIVEPVAGRPSVAPLLAERRVLPKRRPSLWVRLTALLQGWLGPHPLLRLGVYAGVAAAAFLIVVFAASARPPAPPGPRPVPGTTGLKQIPTELTSPRQARERGCQRIVGQ